MNMAEMKEWTIMFYFAGDNPLAPLVVPQLKNIKDAGFQKKTNVLVYFDPSELGVPTRIYDVNRKRKLDRMKARRSNKGLSESSIGDGRDPFVRNMKEDELTPAKIQEMIDAGSIDVRKEAVKNILRVLKGNIELEAKPALDSFINFCQEAYPASHYILFLVGHGMIVGNDSFLPDDNPVSAITLKDLREILEGFTKKVKNQEQKGAFDLLAMHSCSMSAIEVAYELRDTANFMMASEGPSFAGGWHYRQMLKKSFNSADEKKVARRGAKRGVEGKAEEEIDAKVLELIESLYFLTLHNAKDFARAGYSHDLSLCSLDSKRYEGLTDSIKKLVVILREGLGQPATDDRGRRIKELVLLSHWEAQSYWGESYTDLFDFCLCLSNRCDPQGDLKALHDACIDVMNKLKPIANDDISERFKALVIHSNNFGWEFQYSYGLSIYFPWSKPIETEPADQNARAKAKKTKEDADEQKGALERYKEYAFTEALGKDSWLSFLEAYFEKTEREPREDSRGLDDSEDDDGPIFNPHFRTDVIFPMLDHVKTSGGHGTGCSCPSIKNYPKEDEEKTVNGETKKNLPRFTMTEGAANAAKYAKGASDD